MPGSRTTIEALVVAYNSVDDIEDCLRSLLDSAPQDSDIDFSVAVLENGSPRSCAEVVRTKFPEVRLLEIERNRLFGGGMNLLVDTSRADYVLIMNPDTVTPKDICTPLLEALREDPAAIVAGPKLVYPDGTLQQSVTRFPGVDFEIGLLLQNTRLGSLVRPVWDPRKAVARVRQDLTGITGTTVVESLWATVWLMKRADALAYGPFNPAFPMYDEDLDFCLRARKDGRHALYVPAVEVVHIGGASSTSEQKRQMMRRARRTLHRHHSNRVAALAYEAVDSGLERLRQLKARRAG
ncbi:hypothetical protein EV189_2794 [Motilibacter rhizosphaerae]|uniref:Glycosyltransferase 2-like domain-containing protein n=1 Tax=Motilibacter rhizosphaerae TaxID=598652 RepID=A0A4Q7NQR8_9ACTN|nr:glycosyltransferase family 2 protein [Motilibacter rhizosphaerae]RZS87366.1 hypothetical protein EV189_2794 [Motilibacter rhizosphaerae]